MSRSRNALAPADAATATADATGAEDVRWDLTDLFDSVEALDGALATAEAEAEAIAGESRGTLASLPAAGLAALLDRIAGVIDAAGRAYAYASLDWSTDTEDPARGALLQRVQEAYTRIAQHLLFVEVEWARLDEDRAAALLADPALAGHRHHLELKYAAREHVLSEPEESILADKAITGAAAWTRFYDETLGAARFDVGGEALPLSQALARLHEPDREARRAAHKAITDGLAALQHPLTFVFNTILADKATNDRLRRYDSWLASRNESNEISADSVDALVTAVSARSDLAQRFYRLKARLLGLDDFSDYDRYAPLGEADRAVPYGEAERIVHGAYADFHPELGAIVQRFYDGRWIDAPPVPGKRGGAFSHGTVPSVHPYILLNYTGKLRDVQTLAHELGHGVHQYLSRAQGLYHADTPLTTAETASVFGEMLTFQRLLGELDAPADRLALVVEKIDDSMATVFRQVSMNRFEAAVHAHRRERGELTADDFAQHWITTQADLYGDAVHLTEGYRRWWSYIPHFVHTPGYVYAYAFGELLVLALYARYVDEGDAFAEKYLDLLRAGGSDYPHVLLSRLGIDLQDPDFWLQGLGAIEALVGEAEALADEVHGAPAA